MSKVLDKAIKTIDAVSSSTINDYARYLWRWEGGTDLPSELIGSLIREAPFESVPENRNKAYAWASKEALKELDSVYSKLKAEVNSLLKKGYEANKRRIKELGKM